MSFLFSSLDYETRTALEKELKDELEYLKNGPDGEDRTHNAITVITQIYSVLLQREELCRGDK